jgi:iturin family lipopeptide synthetase A/iturin family lipopeptide synthetase C/tyrocidine synthetase-3
MRVSAAQHWSGAHGEGMDHHMTPASDQHRLVVAFNDTSRPYPAGESIVALFQAQVDRTPDAEVLRFGRRALSYQDLDRQSDHVAERLRAMGGGPGELVALHLEHSLEAVAAILGVLKVGAAYVPLASGTPPERLRAILRDMATAGSGAAPAVIVHDTLAHGVPDDMGRRLVLELDAPLPAASARVRHSALPSDLAYVIFTSGSTGRPKGVMIEHRSLVNYAWWAAEQYTCGERTTWPLFSSLAFDLTVTSIFVPLITGGRLVVYRERPGAAATVVLDVVADRLADVVKLTPAHLAMLAQADLTGSPIRRFVVGGEDFKTGIAREVAGRFPHPVEIYNEYGPTEATVGCMIHRYDPESDRGTSVSIGRPAANSQVYVLDADRHPVPPGVIGEMYLGGDGLARGYFRQPDLTAAAFVETADPRAPETGAPVRLYKTGDLARWTIDGRMEFLGRADDQVKIGGFRIELGEIEAALATHPAVSSAVAIVSTPAAGVSGDGARGHLVAYYVADREIPLEALRAHLARSLPDYMVPASFARLDALPLTANGKVDRARLPTPAIAAVPSNDRPRTPIEQRVVDVWREVLGVGHIGLDDDFFAVGGHSLAAMRVLSRIRDAFDVDLPLDVMFVSPTPARVATAIADEQAAAAGSMPVARLQPLARPRAGLGQ